MTRPTQKFDLDYSGPPEGKARAQFLLRSKLVTWLDLPAGYNEELAGPSGAERLRKISHAIRGEVASDDDSMQQVDPRDICDELSDVASALIDTSIDLVRKKADDPESKQHPQQTEWFEDRLSRFDAWFRNGRDCTCEVCSGAKAALTTLPASFRSDRTLNVPLCIRRFAREAELARFFVERLYGDLLPVGCVRADVVFAIPASGQFAVNGNTLFSRPGSMRRPPLKSKPKRTVNVTLSLPADLNLEHLMSIVYVLAHELGVHGVQQMGLDRAPRRDSTDVAFNEGLVDAAVYDALQQIFQDEKSRYLVRSAYADACRKRHDLHLRGKNAEKQNSSDISLGSELFGTLVRFGDAAGQNNIIEFDKFLSGKRAIWQLDRILNGRHWARRLVLALNLLPFDRKQVMKLFCWLSLQLDMIGSFDGAFAELKELKKSGGVFPSDDPLVQFLHVLQQVARNPHSPRIQNRLLRKIGE